MRLLSSKNSIGCWGRIQPLIIMQKSWVLLLCCVGWLEKCECLAEEYGIVQNVMTNVTIRVEKWYQSITGHCEEMSQFFH